MNTPHRMHRSTLASALCLSLIAASAIPAASDPADAAMAAIRPEAIRCRYAFPLGQCPGRPAQPSTRGHEIAASFMAAQFESLGLEPAGDKGTYFQSVPLRASRIDASKTTMSWTVAGKQQTLVFHQDFIVTPDPARPNSSVEAPVVFVGFGITSPELHYDDYQGVDAKGKIVAVIYGAPPQFESSLRAHYSSGVTKRAIAVAHGAVGYVTLYDPGLEHLYSFQHRVKDMMAPDLSWLDPEGPSRMTTSPH